jgi:serine/threonine-protein kinase ATR
MESAKLVKAIGEPLRALQELENSMRLLGLIETDVIDLTDDDDETKKMKAKVSSGFSSKCTSSNFFAKAQVLRARWMKESDRFETTQVMKAFLAATELQTK